MSVEHVDVLLSYLSLGGLPQAGLVSFGGGPKSSVNDAFEPRLQKHTKCFSLSDMLGVSLYGIICIN